jgi:beta-aspartyl-dipeptidase (metallo-type)
LPHFNADGELQGMGVGDSATLLQAVREATTLGVPFDYALATVTRNPARHFRLHGKGGIEVGADADLCVLDDDGGVSDLWARGRRMVSGGRAVVRGLFESAPDREPRRG